MYKIYESDNYIIVTKVENGETFYGHKKNVFIDKNNTNKPFYSIFNVKDFKEDTVLKIGEIQKQDGTLYTEAEFDTFYRTNTGNFNGGGTAPTGDFLSNDETSYIDATLPLTGTELALVEQGGTFKKVAVSEFGGGEENVQSDWNQINILADDFIKNKPELFSGDYNDLINTPALVTNHSELNLDDGTNPHGTTKNDVGLGNADNTSDLGKPISNATQTALNGKANTIHSHVISDVTGLQTALNSKLDKVTTNDVEKVYIKNADGTQSTKPTSDFGTVKGTGTINRISKFTAGGTIGDSQIFDDGTNVGIGTTSPQARLDVVGSDPGIRQSIERTSGGVAFSMFNLNAKNTTSGLSTSFGSIGVYGNLNVDPTPPSVGYIYMGADSTTAYNDNTFRLYPGKIANFQGNVGIGTTSPQARLDVRAQGVLATDIVLRVRNSTDTQNFLVVNGAGDVYNNGAKGVNTNTFFGENVGRNATGGYNTAIGQNALRANTTGGSNTAIGTYALYTNTTGNSNMAIGQSALQNNTTGGSNMAIGVSALQNNTTGASNAAIGTYALRANTTGGSNMAIGTSALQYNTTGNSNAAIGFSALLNNTTGANNIAIGNGSLQNNTTATNNTAVGIFSLYSNTTGLLNTAIGNRSLQANISGGDNVAIGNSAARYTSDGFTDNTTSNNSIFLGSNTAPLANNQTNQIVIGHRAIGLGSDSVVLGNDSITITQLRGQVIMGAFYSEPTGIDGAIYYDSSTKKHRGFNGVWNDLY